MTNPADIEQDSSRDIKYMSMDSENDYSIQDDSDFKNQIVYVLNKIFQRIQGIYHWIIKMITVSNWLWFWTPNVDVITFYYYPSDMALLQQGQLNCRLCTQTTAIEKKSFVTRGMHVEVSLFKYFHKGLLRRFKFKKTSSDRGTNFCIDQNRWK